MEAAFNMAASCGCLRDCTEEHDVIVFVCEEHLHKSVEFERAAHRNMGLELDDLVREAVRGRKCERIWRVG